MTSLTLLVTLVVLFSMMYGYGTSLRPDRKLSCLGKDQVRFFDNLNDKIDLSERFKGVDPRFVFTIVVSVIFDNPPAGPYPWARAPAAVTMAIENFCKENNSLTKFVFDIFFLDDGCTREDIALSNLLQMQSLNIDVIVGMRCARVNMATGRYLAYKDIPSMSTQANRPMLSDKTIFKTLIRMTDSYKYIGTAMIDLFQQYKWKRVMFLAPRVYNRCEHGMQVVREQFIESGITIIDWIFVTEADLPEDTLRNLMKYMKERARVMFICLGGPNTQRFVKLANELDMLKPDFVYFILSERVDNNIVTPWGERPEGLTNKQWRKRIDLFSRIQYVTVPDINSVETEKFLREIYIRSQLPPFNYTEKQLGNEEMTEDRNNRELITLYDATTNWLRNVDELLRDGTNPRSGRNQFRKSSGAVFQGKHGVVKMDGNADKLPTYLLWRLFPGFDKFVVAATIDFKKQKRKRIKYVKGLPPYWATKDGEAPSDTPPSSKGSHEI